MKQDAWNFLVDLRKNVIAAILGIKNSGSEDNGQTLSFTWDNTTPNYITKRNLKRIRNEAILDLPKFGIYIVTRHDDCVNPNHHKVSQSKEYGYVMENPYGIKIPYDDKRFLWKDFIFAETRKDFCPCTNNNPPFLII